MLDPRPSRGGRRRRRAFTLLEVLAAVAVVGLVFTLLAQVSIVWLRRSGESIRKLEAGLLADRYLGDLQTQVLAGSAPEPGVQSHQEEPFEVEVEVTPLGLAEVVSQAGLDLGGDAGGQPRPFLETAQGDASPLLQLQVRVLWEEGVYERSTSRTSFAIDPSVAEGLLEGLGQDGDGEDEDAEGLSDGATRAGDGFRR